MTRTANGGERVVASTGSWAVRADTTSAIGFIKVFNRFRKASAAAKLLLKRFPAVSRLLEKLPWRRPGKAKDEAKEIEFDDLDGQLSKAWEADQTAG